MKKPNKKQMKKIGVVVLLVALVVAGNLGTLGYQHFINNVKSNGVVEYTTNKCEKFADVAKKTTWLECNVVKG
jgi:hypothetical protein